MKITEFAIEGESIRYEPPQANKDVVVVVRCKDCIHYHQGFNCDLLQKPIMKDSNWFCADGRRRNEKHGED